MPKLNHTSMAFITYQYYSDLECRRLKPAQVLIWRVKFGARPLRTTNNRKTRCGQRWQYSCPALPFPGRGSISPFFPSASSVSYPEPKTLGIGTLYGSRSGAPLSAQGASYYQAANNSWGGERKDILCYSFLNKIHRYCATGVL